MATDNAGTPVKPPDSPQVPSSARTIARNTAAGVGIQLFLKIATIIFNILVVRTLGGAEVGQLNIVLAWVFLFAVIGDLGVAQYYAREIARERGKARDLFWDVVALRIILAFVCTVVTIGVAIAISGYSQDILVGIFIFTLTYFFQAFIAPISSMLIGYERVDLNWLLLALQQVFTLILQTIVLALGLGFVWLLVAGLVNMPIMLVVTLILSRRTKLEIPPPAFQPARWWVLLRHGLPFGLQQVMLSLGLRADTVILSLTRVPNLVIGWYAVAYTYLVLMITNIVASFSGAVMPTLAREHVNNPEIVKSWYFRSVKYLLFIGLPIAVGGMVLALPIIDLLYPEELPAFLPLMILVWDIPFVMYHSFCGYLTTSIQKEVPAARIHLTMALANVTMNIFLIPRLGIIGASFATVMTDLCGAMLFYVLLRKEFGPGLGFVYLFRIPICAAIMGIILLLLPDWHVLIKIGIGTLIYVPLIFASGTFTGEERQQLLNFGSKITRRLRPRTA
jgi:O-antigen/teichoic acid export membrane protein